MIERDKQLRKDNIFLTPPLVPLPKKGRLSLLQQVSALAAVAKGTPSVGVTDPAAAKKVKKTKGELARERAKLLREKAEGKGVPGAKNVRTSM